MFGAVPLVEQSLGREHQRVKIYGEHLLHTMVSIHVQTRKEGFALCPNV